MPPSPDSLAIAYRILCAHQNLSLQSSSDVGTGKELLAFYNCGQDSGASQPHQHIQFAELGGEGDQKARHSIPIEVLLDTIAKDGKEEGKIVHLIPPRFLSFFNYLQTTCSGQKLFMHFRFLINILSVYSPKLIRKMMLL